MTHFSVCASAKLKGSGALPVGLVDVLKSHCLSYMIRLYIMISSFRGWHCAGKRAAAGDSYDSRGMNRSIMLYHYEHLVLDQSGM